MININQCFDKEGNFVDHVNPFQVCDHPIIQFLFDSDGYVAKTREVENLLMKIIGVVMLSNIFTLEI